VGLNVWLAAGPVGIELAAKVARHGGPNVAAALPWVVPLLLGLPVAGYAVLLGAVRGRRAAGNLGLLVVLIMLAISVVVTGARFGSSSPYHLAYQWINIPVAVSGDQRFQGFGIDLAFHIDRPALAGLLATLVIVLAALLWHRFAARAEQGPVRFQVNVLLLVLGATGVLISQDLAELAAFWLATAVGTYLLLGHRWGTEGAGRRGQLSLALPLAGDLALLCAVAILYSNFGTLDMTSLWPQLRTAPGVGPLALAGAALLLLAATLVRGGVWPFTPWLTGAVDAPPSALAIVAGVWPVLAASVLFRALPLVAAAGVPATRTASYALGVAAVVGPLLSLLGVEMRRALLLASAGAVAVALLGVLYPASTAVGFTVALAIGMARAGVLLAAGAATGALRSADLRVAGEGWRRMPSTTLTLLLGAVVVTVAGYEVLALRPLSIAWLALGPALALMALGTFRVYVAVGHGPLRRRRAFEPSRVREIAALAAGAALVSVVLGVGGILLGGIERWVAALQPGGRSVPAPDGGWPLLALAALVIGLLAASLVGLRKDVMLQLSAALGERELETRVAVARVIAWCLISLPSEAVRALEERVLPAFELGLGRALVVAGGLANRRPPLVPTVLGLALVLALAFGLLSREVMW
jgi:NADH:ubiquinone oxidoreductase subunit 5 (subunit L)/multisubunit Na+/H+ antiporter MnhA subunit